MKVEDFLAKYPQGMARHTRDKYRKGRYSSNINNYSPIKIDIMNQNLYSNELIDVVDNSDRRMGTLYLLKDKTQDPSAMSDAVYAAYIEDIEDEVYGTSYTFKYNYLVVYPGNIRRYMTDFNDSSIVWGGFSTFGSVTLPVPEQRGLAKITALGNISQKHSYQYELLALAEQQPYAFERYLRYYHYFEYMFEAKIVDEIRSTPLNLDGYTGIMRELSKSSEMDRLKYVLVELLQPTDAPEINRMFSLLKITKNRQIAMDILFRFGKEFNPLKGREREFEELIDANNFTPAGLALKKIQPNDKLFFSFICYTVYRIRCCIAHTKLSEYILKPTEESFVAEFAEALIRYCVLKHAQM